MCITRDGASLRRNGEAQHGAPGAEAPGVSGPRAGLRELECKGGGVLRCLVVPQAFRKGLSPFERSVRPFPLSEGLSYMAKKVLAVPIVQSV